MKECSNIAKYVTFELSRVLRGRSPPLQISHSVVPKLHLSAARLRFRGLSTHSGGTHGILCGRTARTHACARAHTHARTDTNNTHSHTNMHTHTYTDLVTL